MKSKRIVAFLLSLAMIIGSVPAFVFAEDEVPADEPIPTETIIEDSSDEETEPSEEANANEEPEEPEADEESDPAEEPATEEPADEADTVEADPAEADPAELSLTDTKVYNDAQTDPTKCGDDLNWYYSPDNKTLTICGSGAMYNYDATNKAPWNNADNYETIGKNMKVLVIEEGVKSIGDYAFNSCTSLEDLTLTSDIETIGVHAFSGCGKILSLCIPASVTSVGESAFSSCGDMRHITIPPKVTSIGNNAFAYCNSLDKIYMTPRINSIEDLSIGDNCFPTHNRLEIFVPDSCYSTYGSHPGINPSTLQEMYRCGESVYWYAYDMPTTNPTKRIIFAGVGDMYDYSKQYKAPWIGIGADDAYFLDGITSVGKYAFYTSEITYVTFYENKSLTYLRENAFKECESLERVKDLPSTLTHIEESAFDGCSALFLCQLENLDKLDTINDKAFRDCTSLKEIVIPQNVHKIGVGTFRGCTNMTDVFCAPNPNDLWWVEYDRDDFKENDATLIHVKREYYNDYLLVHKWAVRGTFVPDYDWYIDLGSECSHIYGYSVSVGGDIAVNFYVAVPDDLDDSAYMQFKVDGVNGVQQVTLGEVKRQGKTGTVYDVPCYIFTCKIPAKNMASTITAQMINGNERGSEYEFSVKEYAEYLYDSSTDEEVKKVVKAMLNYGAYTQLYLDYNIENLANSRDGMAYMGGGNEAEVRYYYSPYDAILPDGATLASVSLSFKSELTLSFAFKSTEELSFSCDNYIVEKETSNGYQIARVRGINPADLNQEVGLDINDHAYYVIYSPANVCDNVLKSPQYEDNENLLNLMKALLLFRDAVRDYKE